MFLKLEFGKFSIEHQLRTDLIPEDCQQDLKENWDTPSLNREQEAVLKNAFVDLEYDPLLVKEFLDPTEVYLHTNPRNIGEKFFCSNEGIQEDEEVDSEFLDEIDDENLQKDSNLSESEKKELEGRGFENILLIV